MAERNIQLRLSHQEGARQALGYRPSSSRPCIFEAYLVWLYRRSFSLVVMNIDHSFDEEERLLRFLGLLHFALKPNLPRRGSERDNERDNDQIRSSRSSAE